MERIKNVQEVVKFSEEHGWCELWYHPRENRVGTSYWEGAWHLTDLIRPNTAQEVVDTVRKYVNM